jgi:hypothetical protein
MGRKATDLIHTNKIAGLPKDGTNLLANRLSSSWFFSCQQTRETGEGGSIMNTVTTKTLSLIIITLITLFCVSGHAWALSWTYQYDPSNDASGGWGYEVYRLGYAVDEESLYVKILTSLPQGGRQYGNAMVNAGDLFINVGGSLRDGYDGTGTGTTYASGEVFGLALSDHAGDTNNDLARYGWARSGYADDGYAWDAVTAGHLYRDAIFATGVYEGYGETRGDGYDGGNDPFGGANNAPSQIAQFGADLGYQGAVSWHDLGYTAVNDAGTITKYAYEVNAVVSLEALGITGGETFELWWSMECGNDITRLTGTMPQRSAVSTPEPGTLLLLGFGLMGVISISRKRQS